MDITGIGRGAKPGSTMDSEQSREVEELIEDFKDVFDPLAGKKERPM
jgi:hypothetical protein